jgi:hypothetical protein
MAMEILRQAPRRSDREFLFGERVSAVELGEDGARQAPSRNGTSTRTLDVARHSAQRTNRLGKLGVAPHIAELCLGHVAHKVGIVGTSDHHDYSQEIADALAKWSRALLAILEPPPVNVIELSARVGV